MPLFGKSREEVRAGVSPESAEVESGATTLGIYLPKTLVSSDIELAKLETKDGVPYPRFDNIAFTFSDIFWFQQFKEAKESRPQGPRDHGEKFIKLDKFLVHLQYRPMEQKLPTRSLYVMTDIFFDPSLGYLAKALGVYSSIPRVLSVNFKHHGELKAERRKLCLDFTDSVWIIPDTVKFEKRARPLFAWLELASLM